jgi:hypothetical protein
VCVCVCALYLSPCLTNSVSLCPSLTSRFMALIFILDALFTALSHLGGPDDERGRRLYDVRANLAFWQRNKLSKTPPRHIMYARPRPGVIYQKFTGGGRRTDLICEYTIYICTYIVSYGPSRSRLPTLPRYRQKLEACTLRSHTGNRTTIIIISSVFFAFTYRYIIHKSAYQISISYVRI